MQVTEVTRVDLALRGVMPNELLAHVCKPDQEKVASSEKDVKRKKCQGERVPRDHAGNGCDNQATWLRSNRLSLFFIGFSPAKLP